jgi:hypothetical protein
MLERKQRLNMKSLKLNFASLALATSVLFAGACASDLTADKPSPGSSLTQLSNGPDLPEECNECWDTFQECFAEGNALEECGANIVECADACQAPPPPAECLHCAAGFDACVTASAEAGGNGEDCAAGFEGCLFACESDCSNSPEGCLPECVPGDEGEPNDQDPGDNSDPGQDGSENCEPIEPPLEPHDLCEEEFNQCFDDLWQQDPANADEAAQICDDLLGECFNDCPLPEGEDGNFDDGCFVDFEACLNEAADVPDQHFFECEEILIQCEREQFPDDFPEDQFPDGQDPSNP